MLKNPHHTLNLPFYCGYCFFSVMYYINWRVCARVCFYVLATVCVSVCFSEEYVLFLHAAKFHNISRNYWSAALDISISNLIQTWVLPRDAEFHQRKQDKPNIVNTRFFFPPYWSDSRNSPEIRCKLKRAENMIFPFLQIKSTSQMVYDSATSNCFDKSDSFV